METFSEFVARKELQTFGKPKHKMVGKWGGDRHKNPFKIDKPAALNPSVAMVTGIPEGPMRSVKGKLTSMLKREKCPCKPRRPGIIPPQSK